jgi:hypothetical protein
MSVRKDNAHGLPVVRIGGVPYVLDARKRRLRSILDGGVIELDTTDE